MQDCLIWWSNKKLNKPFIIWRNLIFLSIKVILFAESKNTPICGKRDELCANRARRGMEVKLYDEELTNPLNVTEMWVYFSELHLFLARSKTAWGHSRVLISRRPSCNCMPACFEISYRVEMSQNKLTPIVKINKRFVKKNMDYFT